MIQETDDDPNSRSTARLVQGLVPPLPHSNFNSYNQYGGSLPSSPPEYDTLYDDMNGGGIDPLHDELLQMCRATGIENIAKDSGLIKNGEIAVLKDYARDHSSIQPLHKGNSVINAVTAPISTISNIMTNPSPKISSTPLYHSDQRPANQPPSTPAILSHPNHKSSYSHPPNPDKSTDCIISPTSTSTHNSESKGSTTSPPVSSTTTAAPASTHSISSASSFQSSHSGDDSGDEGPGKKRKRSNAYKVDKDDKGHNKGLRHFSLKVCQKVETKRTTSYNEVADELVGEIQANSEQVVTPVEQKNIRRRVYDVLNVLMAMNIISKDKKEIHWIGLPSESKKPHDEYKKEKQQRLERIKKKKENLAELMAQQVSYRNLLARNNKPDHSSTPMKNRIYLPFIVVNTKAQTVINCEVAHDRTKYFFNFSNPFEIYDDNEVLKRMGLGSCTYNDEPGASASGSPPSSASQPDSSSQLSRDTIP